MEIEKRNYGEILLAVSSLTWSVTLRVFTIDGELPFDLFILTRSSPKGKFSELYYFQQRAEEAFCRWALKYEKMESEKVCV